MVPAIVNALHAIGDFGGRIFGGGLVCLALELLLPASRYSLVSRLRAAVFWSVSIVITGSVYSVFNGYLAEHGIHPLYSFDLRWWSSSKVLPLQIAGWIGAFIVAGWLGDFFYYWFHRLQHASPLLWRFHSVHHSLREMSGLNSAHHFTEHILRIPFIALPLGLLVGADPGTAPVLVLPLIFWVQSMFIHSCTRIQLGWLRYVVADNRYHRIHHSTDPRDMNKNFGAFSSIWDLVFGTARFPEAQEWPAVGLAHVDEPRTVSDYLWRPFRSNGLP
jgi:sterol desaturase/sphingolipid hydroxylase (fatty acid hydroxylase superfamily)